MERLVLPPGFRFHPTDEELVSHYLKRKVCGRKIDFEAIAEIDLYKYEPWDLPEKSFLQTRDLEWYFFVPRDRKYTNGSRTNRATERGYWKSTGKDRFVSSASRIVGTKKTLVYYSGRAPKGDRTNWVMHEYRLNDSESERAHASQNGYVLCRIYQKSGAGPKNGEQYGAPVEDDDDFVSSPAAEQDRCGSFTASLLEAGPPMASVHDAESPVSISGNEAVFNGMEWRLCCPDIQLRNLQFIDSASNTVSEVLQRESNSFTKENLGHSVNPKDFVVVPSECHEEEKIIRELYELVSDPDRTNSKEGFEGSDSFVVTEHLGTDALPPRYGDFLELDDLMMVSEIEEGVEDSIGPAHGTNDCQWQDSSFGDQWKDKQQNGSKETGILQSKQMESPSYSSGLNAQYQAVRDILLEDLLAPRGGLKNEVVGVAHHTDSIEPDYEDVLEFFDQVSACATKNKPFSLECLAENVQRGLLQSEVWKNDIVVPSEDGQYDDAGASLPCILNSQVEPGNLTKHAANNYGTLVGSVGALPALEGMAALNNEVCSVHQESLVKPTDRTTDGSHFPQAEGTTAAVQAKHSPSPLSLLWNCLDSLPTLPASAADLSRQAAVSLRITSFAAEEVIGEHETDFDLGKKLVKALSFNEQKKEPMTKGWSMGFWALALLGGVWAVFWLLIVGGGWNLLGGVYRFMVPNER